MTKEKSAWPKARKFFNDVHLWLGLISGIIIFMVCLSGTIYVFNTEVKEMATPHLYKVEVADGAKKLPIETLMKKVAAEVGGKVVSVKIPSQADRTYTITIKKPEEAAPEKGVEKRSDEKRGEKKPEGREKRGEGGPEKGKEKKGEKEGPQGGNRGTAYMVNPYTGEVLGDLQSAKTFSTEFMKTLFSLHRWLLLDKIEEPIFGELENRKLGSYITGIATILFTFGVITGIIIWIPRKVKSWKNGLKVKWSSNWKRINHDLHNSLGFYTCIILLVMGLTGPFFSFSWYRDGLRKSLGTYQAVDAPKPEEPISNFSLKGNFAQLNINDYLAAADKELAYSGDYTVTLPADSVATVNITKNKIGFFAPAAADKLTLDQYSASVLKKEVFKDKPFNERLSGSVKALHLGDVYGMFSKIIYFISCLIATSLPVTGTLIWINKMKK
ncbi:PepSY-associated TM helix domain-containing protein [Pedobacter cryophilus]|uniref:PepSY domain-containing protein n=1 Tax=Pedobacter cryophilus TaxID=2571271 RepID=A0A4U1C1L4_9SPHI|nr:PepSY-associated TM helix domain-containing protein [Pedobacter cryophilus]TKB99111.1 PepSY domain-containing protein [Pedobacter cryophilus]